MDIKRFLVRVSSNGSTSVARGGLVAVVALGLIGLGTIGCSKLKPASAKSPDELLTELKDDRTEIDQATDAMMKRIDEFNASRKPGERTLQFSEVFSQDLSPEQQDVLNAMMAQEADISYKALLQKIIGDRDAIQGLQEHIQRLEQTLPDQFVVAKRGDKHHELAMAYLTGDAHLDAAKAKTLLGQADQTDELVPGNKVWFFYDPQRDTFRTYVTQGEAGQTPLAVRRAKQRKLIQERDSARAEVATLQDTKAGLENDVATLSQAKADLESDLALHENSLFYHAADERSLKELGVLSSVFKKVRDVKGVQYNESLDLREATTITLTPEQYGLTEIRNVRLLPAIYQEGRDFTVETAEDHSSARIVILDPDVFRGKEVLLAVRG